MTETKFTPGPWSVSWNADIRKLKTVDCQVSRTFTSDAGSVDAPVAYCPFMADLEDYSKDAGTAMDNASLIAAAPDLYAALYNVMLEFGPGTMSADAFNGACAALSKARGES